MNTCVSRSLFWGQRRCTWYHDGHGVVIWYPWSALVKICCLRCSLKPFQVAPMTTSNTSTESQTRKFKSNLRVVKNMAIIMGLFVICWLPFLVLNIVESTDPAYYMTISSLLGFHTLALAMFLFNSIVNPIVYAVRFRNFNVAFRLMFGCLSVDDRHTAMESVTSVWE